MKPYAKKVLNKLTDKEVVVFFFHHLHKLDKNEVAKMRRVKDIDYCLACIDDKFGKSGYYIIKRDHEELIDLIQKIFCD